MIHVLVTGKISHEGLDILKEFARVTVVENPSFEELAQVIPTVDAILHKIGKLPAKLLELGPKIQIIARHGVGLDDLDLPYLESKGIKLTTTHDANSNAVAEFTIALMLVLKRRIMEAHHKLVTTGFWQRELLMGDELRGQTLGLIGFGRIGTKVAEMAHVFGMKIVVYEPFKKLTHPFVSQVGLADLLLQSDVVSVHCPLTAETKGLLDRNKLSLMKKNAVLINTARGGIVDENAVLDLIRNKEIAGAALDTFSVEPPHYLKEQQIPDNLILTPHIAAMTQAAQVAMAAMAAGEIKKHFGM